MAFQLTWALQFWIVHKDKSLLFPFTLDISKPRTFQRITMGMSLNCPTKVDPSTRVLNFDV